MHAFDAHKALYIPNIFRPRNIHNSKVYFAPDLIKFKTTDKAVMEPRLNSYNIVHFNNDQLLFMSQKNRFFFYFYKSDK